MVSKVFEDKKRLERVILCAMCLAYLTMIVQASQEVAFIEMVIMIITSYAVVKDFAKNNGKPLKIYALFTLVNFTGAAIYAVAFSFWEGLVVIVAISVAYTVLTFKYREFSEDSFKIQATEKIKCIAGCILLLYGIPMVTVNLITPANIQVNRALERSSNVLSESLGINKNLIDNVLDIMKVLPLASKCEIIDCISAIEIGDLAGNIENVDTVKFESYVDYVVTENETLNDFYEEQSAKYEVVDYLTRYKDDELGASDIDDFKRVQEDYIKNTLFSMEVVSTFIAMYVLIILLCISLSVKWTLAIVLKCIEYWLYKRGLKNAGDLDKTI